MYLPKSVSGLNMLRERPSSQVVRKAKLRHSSGEDIERLDLKLHCFQFRGCFIWIDGHDLALCLLEGGPFRRGRRIFSCERSLNVTDFALQIC